MFKSLAKSYNKPFCSYKPFPKIENRLFWNSLPKDVKSSYNSLVKPYINFSYPSLPASLFMRFCRKGNRTDYEDAYFKRRYALNTLVIAECIEDNGRYLDDIVDGIFHICEESAWQLPAHNSYVRNSPNQLLADASRPVLDLFACETGALLAALDYVMGSKLDSISPTIRKRIKDELDKRIITPYLKEHFWWMGKEDEPMNNWTIWCTQNILFTFFMTKQSNQDRQEAFLKANKSVDYFLKEYGVDGCCDEGGLYYRHAGLCLFNTIELLNHITDGFYKDIYKSEKIINICSYIYNIHIDSNYYINFADCSAVLNPSGVREFLFAKRTNNVEMMDYAAHDYSQSNDPFISEEINLFYRLQAIYHHKEITKHTAKKQPTPKDTFYPSVGLFIVRDSNYTLAVKAGHNDDNHNHNDTGSFIIYKDGHPLFIDIGVESYTSKTFSNKRYEIWTMQSDYHNLPTINGKMQLPGPDYKANKLKYSLNQNTPYIHMNLANAYPAMENIKEFIREVQLYKDSHIQIKDELVSHDPQIPFNLISNLITYTKPHIDNNKLFIGELALVTLEGEIEKIEIETLPITDPRLQQAWKDDLYRIRIHYHSAKLKMKIK